MEANNLPRPLTFRVENIPCGTTAEGLKKHFHIDDQPYVDVRSFAPAIDSADAGTEHTATILFQPPNKLIQEPRINLESSLSIDREFHGFTPLNDPSGPIAADIVAVTGLAGHAFASWAHSPKDMWLRDYLPRDVNNIRVLIYGYASELYGSMSSGIISDHSNNFTRRLLSMREEAKCSDRPIIFIGHSLGCLIIKETLSDTNGTIKMQDSRLPVREIIFLGAPHRGLNVKALETLVESQPTEDLIRELRPGSPTLTSLNNRFKDVVKDVHILTCYELNRTKTAKKMDDGSWKRDGPPEMMVSPDSAKQGYPLEDLVACSADHSQIAKLKRGENSIYPDIKRTIKNALRGLTEVQAPVKSSDTSAFRIPLRQRSSRGDSDEISKSTTLDNDMASAIMTGDATKVRNLIEQGYDVDCRDEEGNTILLLAAWLRQDSIIEAALECGADSLAVNKRGLTTLHLTALPKDGQKPMSKFGLDLLLQHKPPLDVSDEYGITPLMSMARYGLNLGLERLLEHGANIFATNKQGRTCLHRAAEFRKPETAKLLIARGSHMDARTSGDWGFTPLHLAARESGIDAAKVIETLLHAGADVEARTISERWTSLHLAVYNNNEHSINELLKFGADIEAQKGDNWRPLQVAAFWGKTSMVELLLKHGANPYAGDTMKKASGFSMKPSSHGFAPNVPEGSRKEIQRILQAAERSYMLGVAKKSWKAIADL